MTEILRRAAHDLRDRRHVESYVVAAASLAVAALSLFTDLVGDDLRWAVTISGIGLLVYRITVPEDGAAAGGLLGDRAEFEATPLELRLGTARELWLFAPSGAHVLTSAHCDALRRTVLARGDGSVRVVVMDPRATGAVAQAAHQLTESVDYPGQRFPESLSASLARLRTMFRWRCPGAFAVRLLPYSPGFSLIAIDPNSPGGMLIVEFHGVRNASTSDRMHLTLTRDGTGRWYAYWLAQFEHIWRTARALSQS